MINANPKLAHK